MDNLKQILDLASRMAVVLIGSGAEISRVEETLQHISDHFEVDRTEMFVIANGLFVSMQKGGGATAKSYRLSSSSVCLCA